MAASVQVALVLPTVQIPANRIDKVIRKPLMAGSTSATGITSSADTTPVQLRNVSDFARRRVVGTDPLSAVLIMNSVLCKTWPHRTTVDLQNGPVSARQFRVMIRWALRVQAAAASARESKVHASGVCRSSARCGRRVYCDRYGSADGLAVRL